MFSNEIKCLFMEYLCFRNFIGLQMSSVASISYINSYQLTAIDDSKVKTKILTFQQVICLGEILHKCEFEQPCSILGKVCNSCRRGVIQCARSSDYWLLLLLICLVLAKITDVSFLLFPIKLQSEIFAYSAEFMEYNNSVEMVFGFLKKG